MRPVFFHCKMSSQRRFRCSVNRVQRPTGAGWRGKRGCNSGASGRRGGESITTRSWMFSPFKPVSFVSLGGRYWAKSRRAASVFPSAHIRVFNGTFTISCISDLLNTSNWFRGCQNHIVLTFSPPVFLLKFPFKGFLHNCTCLGSSEAKMLMLLRLYLNFMFYIRGTLLNVRQSHRQYKKSLNASLLIWL